MIAQLPRKSPSKRPTSRLAPTRTPAGQGGVKAAIHYIPNRLFAQRDAELQLDPLPHELEQPVDEDIDVQRQAALRGLPAHLRRMCTDHLLSPAEERALFQRMNYVKYLAAQLQASPGRGRRDAQDQQAIQALLAQGERLRNRLISANIRLVIANAKLFADARNDFDELLSEGLVAMMRAVESFDYDRGFRFSTYATRAIRRNLYRFVIQRRKDAQRFSQPATELSEGAPDDRSVGAFDEQRWQHLQGKLARMIKRLDPRERIIVRARFGLGDSDQAETLQSLAGKLGVCKERVRQLEQRAMSKLQAMAAEAKLESPED